MSHKIAFPRTPPLLWIPFVLLFLICAGCSSMSLACDLPVCDADAQLKILESKNQAFRFQYISKLRQDFGKEKSEVKLNNLLGFSRSAFELIRRLGDEDYVLREAKGLRDQCIFLLVQWVWRDCMTLSKGYSELASETQRYAALDFFYRRVEEFKGEGEIRELVCFAEKAESISMDLNDSDYVARQAVQLGSSLSNQLLEVINGWEGMFRLTSIEGPLSAAIDQLRLILFSSGGELGIVASLSHPTIRPLIFQKLSFNENPHILGSRQSFASQVPSVLNLQFSDDFATLHGSVLDSGEFRTVRFAATRALKINTFSRTPCSEQQILGRFRTKIQDVAGTFTIERIAPRQLAAVFSSNNGSLKLPFSLGRYNENTGRLTFINMQTNVPLGWRLLAEKTPQGDCEVQGWGLSTFTSSHYPLTMTQMK